ncbi:hypothetical protein E2C01_088650 [Portunus trituberculatus]|uniref:Uncharacterized protein n=1 Tax=Portunus trituberculatus TaxID=210409 RepID=A0A5B7JKF2_PORTR|nr:hypothetical protein [Portunus trituberculatus]
MVLKDMGSSKWNRQEEEDEWEPSKRVHRNHSSLRLGADGRTSREVDDSTREKESGVLFR